jgi:hypothetical protein
MLILRSAPEARVAALLLVAVAVLPGCGSSEIAPTALPDPVAVAASSSPSASAVNSPAAGPAAGTPAPRPAASQPPPPKPVDVCARQPARSPSNLVVRLESKVGPSAAAIGEFRISDELDAYVYACGLMPVDRRYTVMALVDGCAPTQDANAKTNEFPVGWGERSDGQVDHYLSVLTDNKTEYQHGNAKGVTKMPEQRVFLTIWDGGQKLLFCGQMTGPG